jgi:protein transport protein SEC24
VPPQNHIPAPPHSSGPALAGPRVRIDPSQMPNPIEAQEMDQNLWDDEDFLSCQSRGVIPLAGTDWRGVDQGESNWSIIALDCTLSRPAKSLRFRSSEY